MMTTSPARAARALPARVLLVDDEPLYANAVRERLQESDFEVAVAEDGRSALEVFERESFDLVILDVALPGLNGLEVAARIRERSDVPIIVISGDDDPDARLRAFDEGADDFIAKDTGFAEVVRRLRAVLRRAGPRGAVRIVTRGGTLIVDSFEARAGAERLPLTRTEFRLLHALATRRGTVVDRDTLSREVWGHETYGDANYVQSHVSRLRKKLAAAGIRDLVETVYDVGYVIR
jgi:DNA-binding response OmpR family regulator